MEYYLSTLMRNRSVKNNTQSLLDKIHYYVLMILSRYYSAAISREIALKIKYKYPFLPTIKQSFAQKDLDLPPVLKIYYHNFSLLQEHGNTEHYYEMKNSFFENIEQFDYVDQRRFINYMLNHCTLFTKNNIEEFVYEKHILLRKGLELKVWEIGSYFPPQLFRSLEAKVISFTI